MKFTTQAVAVILAFASSVNAHGAITNAVGNAGGKGAALGIDPTTPRNGAGANPFQRDTTVFGSSKNNVLSPGCGRTRQGGQNNIQNGTQTIIQQNGGTLPQVTAGGQLAMTVHQINGDGAGPYTCAVNTDGTGQTWTNIQVTTQVPGNRGNSRAKATDFPLVAQLPANMACTGTVAGQQNVCIVRCQNPVGPFGGCVPVQAAAAGAGAGAGAGGAANGLPSVVSAATGAANTVVAGAGAGAGNGNGVQRRSAKFLA